MVVTVEIKLMGTNGMNSQGIKIAEIRQRAVAAEAKELMRKWKGKYPDEKLREHKVWQRLNAKYGAASSRQSAVGSPQSAVGSQQAKRLTLEELMALPQEGCEISVTIVNPEMF